MLGYPPLVTPFSQYVKNLALMNVWCNDFHRTVTDVRDWIEKCWPTL